jgi:hypothetical protein
MIEVLKQLVDALENHSAIKHPQQIHYRDAAIEVGKQAIAQLALDAKAENARELGLDYEQEPKDWKTPLKEDAPLVKWAKEQTAPQRTWVGLTDDEIEKVWQNVETSDFEDCVQPFAQAIEAKLKELNT